MLLYKEKPAYSGLFSMGSYPELTKKEKPLYNKGFSFLDY
ncbi:hypothetical protein B425_2028 [Bacillus amyloliquefaciens]|nr:hypothetical protein B425_2028 [Bacillus amyloliquefaciens]